MCNSRLVFFALLNTDNETISLKNFETLTNGDELFCFVLFFSVANAFSLALIHKKLKKMREIFVSACKFVCVWLLQLCVHFSAFVCVNLHV